MNVSRFFQEDRVIFLRSSKKEDAIRELVNAACLSADIPDPELIARLVLNREEEVSTRVSEGVAIPHARLPQSDTTVGCIGLSSDGIAYDGGTVRVVVLMLWAHSTNLMMLSELGRLLRRSDLYDSLCRARTTADVIGVLSNPPTRVEQAHTRIEDAGQVLLHALWLATALDTNAVLVYPDAMGSSAFMNIDSRLPGARAAFQGRVLILTNDAAAYQSNSVADSVIDLPVTTISEHTLTTTSLLFLLSRGILDKTEQVLSVFGEPSSGSVDTIRFTDLAVEFSALFRLPDGGVGDDIDDLVFARVLQIAGELAQEGREGKPAGTIFVVGDYEHVKEHCHQLLINPFRGVPESGRNVLDPGLEETVKEFSRIDGAFVVRGDGVVESAGTYLRADTVVDDLPAGLGARHTAAAAITAVSSAVAIAISESTKRISVFRAGSRVMNA